MLHGDVPGQHHGEVEQHARDPDGSPQQRPLPSQGGKAEYDAPRHGGSHRTFGQRGDANKEVKVEEPELLVRLVPGIPAKHPYAERRSQLHVGRSSAREANNAGAGSGDQGGIQLASGPESTQVEIDQRDQDKSETGRRKTRRPVVDTKLQKSKHGPPVIKRGLLQPGMAPEYGSHVVVPAQHLPGNLRIPWFVGADQSQPISAEDWHQSIEQKEGGKNEKADSLQGFVQGREASLQIVQSGARPIHHSRRTQHCFFLNHRLCQVVYGHKAIRFSV